jgi:hypothetical protein
MVVDLLVQGLTPHASPCRQVRQGIIRVKAPKTHIFEIAIDPSGKPTGAIYLNGLRITSRKTKPYGVFTTVKLLVPEEDLVDGIKSWSEAGI